MSAARSVSRAVILVPRAVIEAALVVTPAATAVRDSPPGSVISQVLSIADPVFNTMHRPDPSLKFSCGVEVTCSCSPAANAAQQRRAMMLFMVASAHGLMPMHKVRLRPRWLLEHYLVEHVNRQQAAYPSP